MQSHRPTDALQCIGAPALRLSRCFNSCLRRAGSNPSRAASTAERCGGGSCCCGLSAVGSIAASLADCPLRAHSLVAGSGCRLAPPVGTLAAACWLEEPAARPQEACAEAAREEPRARGEASCCDLEACMLPDRGPSEAPSIAGASRPPAAWSPCRPVPAAVDGKDLLAGRPMPKSGHSKACGCKPACTIHSRACTPSWGLAGSALQASKASMVARWRVSVSSESNSLRSAGVRPMTAGGERGCAGSIIAAKFEGQPYILQQASR